MTATVIALLAQAQQMGIAPETVMFGSFGVNAALIGLVYKGLASKLDKLGETVQAQALKLGAIETTLNGTGGLVDRVDRLHKWKNDTTVEALQKANAEIERLHREGHLHTRTSDRDD